MARRVPVGLVAVSSDEATVFWQAVQNSAIIAVVATAPAVVLGSMAAFALSRYAFRGRDGLILLCTAGLLFPLNTAALPLFLMPQKIGMNDNLLGVALPEAAFPLPVTTDEERQIIQIGHVARLP
jgi:raffinose/stachyose/melibiose transport system permease protein